MRQYLEVKAGYPDASSSSASATSTRCSSRTRSRRARPRSDPDHPRQGQGGPGPDVRRAAPRGARAYLAKLIELGHRVAICEQVEDPRVARGSSSARWSASSRPGVILDEESLDPRGAQLRGGGGRRRARAGSGWRTSTSRPASSAPPRRASTSRRCSTSWRAPSRASCCSPRRRIVAGSALERAYPRLAQTPVTADDEPAGAARRLRAIADRGGWSPPDARARRPLAARAAARVLRYARATQPAATLPVARLGCSRARDTSSSTSRRGRHLELVETLLDRRRHGLAARRARRDPHARWAGGCCAAGCCSRSSTWRRIRRRHDAVERLVDAHAARDEARKVLGEIGDLERLAGRARLGVATPARSGGAGALRWGGCPRSAGALRRRAARSSRGDSARATICSLLGSDAAPRPTLAASSPPRCVDDAPAAATKEGGFIRRGRLGRARRAAARSPGRARSHPRHRGARARAHRHRARSRSATTASSATTSRSRASHLGNVPADYVRKQTLANAERYVTPELAEYEAQDPGPPRSGGSRSSWSCSTALRGGGRRGGRAAAGAGGAGGGDRRARGARRGGAPPRLRAARGRRLASCIEIDDGRHPVVERLAAGGRLRAQRRALDPRRASRSWSSPGPTWRASRRSCGRWRCRSILAQMGALRAGAARRASALSIASSPASAPATTWRAASRPSWSRCARPRTSCGTPPAARWWCSTRSAAAPRPTTASRSPGRWPSTCTTPSAPRRCSPPTTTSCARWPSAHPRVRNVASAVREWKGEVVFLRKLVAGRREPLATASRSASSPGCRATVVARARQILRVARGGAGATRRGRARWCRAGAGAAARAVRGGAPDAPRLSRRARGAPRRPR